MGLTSHNATQRHTTPHNATQRHTTPHNVAQRRTTSHNAAQRRATVHNVATILREGSCPKGIASVCCVIVRGSLRLHNATHHHAAQRRTTQHNVAQKTHNCANNSFMAPHRTPSHPLAQRRTTQQRFPPPLPQKCPCRTLFHFDTQSTKPR